ncbi:MAG TPA: pantoate--beta-alanine ligase [Planctomycetota bacterium]|nr:pantoate--beta-alanine ligase [Planctomycetota bacterium]OQC19531.1 MAG: Pantothenate synthetase [Planctomycetes bacterium ADurb.Bin069]HNR99900.1 pantoate--beta-alanine ligase [Planctomycetota bacterium]HNU26416.1 pantoate--beta-alanine ligase [Planctomycetota bacterium]HOE31233.1 pantoate--beta-alanine ligase [Planctomycetota bacterium]
MLIKNDAAGVQAWSLACRAAGLRIGFVPTMGALHGGHAALLRAARAECDRVIASVFVNPLQFGPGEDFAAYPRPFERDKALCAEAGVDLLYHGNPEDFYPPGFRTEVRVRELGETLCGRARPGHFEGVCTVVAKLLLRTFPHRAYFGQKDYQQAAIIRRMAADLDIPAAIAVLPTVREPDGLAMSSRNAYLGPAERAAAPCIFRGLSAALARFAAGERGAGALVGTCRSVIAAEPAAAIEYVAAADAESLREYAVEERIGGRAVLAAAVRFGPARLIDNVLLEP